MKNLPYSAQSPLSLSAVPCRAPCWPRCSPPAPVLAQQQAPAAATAPAAAVPATTGVVPVGDVSAVPAPTIAARAWIVIDVNSGQLLAASNPDQKVEPASLTKIMTAYVVFNALEESA